MRAWLRLTRAPLAPTAAADAAAVALLAGWSQAQGLEAWLALVGAALCTYGYGMVLNDWADRERDRTLAPTRPLPSGAIAPPAALALVSLFAVLALVCAHHIGTWPATAAALLCASAYDLGVKRSPAWGAVVLGGARACNAGQVPLALGLATGAWGPAALAALMIGCYAAAITLFSTTEEVDHPGRRVATRVLMSLAWLGAATAIGWRAGGLVAGLFLPLALAAGALSSVAFGRVPRPGTPKKQVLEMLHGLYLLAAVLAGGALADQGPWSLAALTMGFALSVASQLAIRALR